MAAFVAHPRRRDRLATPGATVGERACDGGPEALLAALFRLKAADFPDQGGHFPEQQRPKLLGSAVLGWKFRPNAARDIGHGRRLERLFSVRKAGLSDGTLFSRPHASVSDPTSVGENPRSPESISPESAHNAQAGLAIPMAWGNIPMAGDNRLADPDDDAELLRPSWQDTADETDADHRATWRSRPTIGPAPARGPDTWL